MTIYTFIALTVAVFFASCPPGTDAAQNVEANDITFLQKAAQEQLAEIALGKLAMKKGSDKKVKELGAEIAEDHHYASQEIKDVSAQEGIYLPVDMDDQQKKAQQQLSHLSGNKFDKAFIAYIVKQHRKQAEALQKHSSKLHNENMKQWAQTTEPIVAVHLKKAENVAEALQMGEAK